MTATSTYGRANVLPLTNKSGGQVIAGDVVIVDTTNNDAFTTSTAGSVTTGVGVAQATIASNAVGLVAITGYVALVNVNASVTRGNYGKTFTVAKQATDAGASRVQGTFCQFLTGGTTPDAYIYQPDLGGASLTNPMTTGGDIIYGGASGSPTRLANGSVGQLLRSAGGTSAPTWQLPPAYEYDYVETTSNVTVSGTAETSAGSTLILTSNAATYDGAAVILEFFCPAATPGGTAGQDMRIGLYESTTFLGRIGLVQAAATSGSSDIRPFLARYRFTPTNASHTYLVRGMRTGGDGTLFCGAAGATNYTPMFLRFLKA